MTPEGYSSHKDEIFEPLRISILFPHDYLRLYFLEGHQHPGAGKNNRKPDKGTNSVLREKQALMFLEEHPICPYQP
jgi:hypothetical protein